jgi:hypothetical protein
MFWQFGVIFLAIGILIICLAFLEDYDVQESKSKVHEASLQPPTRYRMVKWRNVYTPWRG